MAPTSGAAAPARSSSTPRPDVQAASSAYVGRLLLAAPHCRGRLHPASAVFATAAGHPLHADPHRQLHPPPGPQVQAGQTRISPALLRAITPRGPVLRLRRASPASSSHRADGQCHPGHPAGPAARICSPTWRRCPSATLTPTPTATSCPSTPTTSTPCAR